MHSSTHFEFSMSVLGMLYRFYAQSDHSSIVFHATHSCMQKASQAFSIHPSIQSQPLLHHRPSPLELRHLPQHFTQILQFRTGECSHQRKLPTRDPGAGAADKVVDVADGMGGVEAGDEAGAVAEADLQG